MSDINATPIDDTERLARLRLIRSENVGPVTYRDLVRHYGSAARVIEILPELARRGGRRRDFRVCSESDAEGEMEVAASLGAQMVTLGERNYPPLLAHVEDAPPFLCVLGDAALLARPTVAIVGSRNASLGGRRVATAIAADLGTSGMVIASGLARGIDGAAHEAALPTGTAAVLAGGIDVVYPPDHRALYGRIATTGVIISEMPPGTKPQGRHFPRRNRLISGVSAGVVVVEAAARSGSLITARFALEQGREVFAVPGSPLDPRSRGANDLIRQGATLTESAKDVLTVLYDGMLRVIEARPQPVPEVEPATIAVDSDVDSARREIEQMLSTVPVMVDEIIRTCQLSPPVVTAVLLEWELAGRIERHPGNRVSMIAASQAF